MGLMYEDLEELCETIGNKIAEANQKIRNGQGDLTGGDLEYIDKLTHAMKSIKTTMAMMDSESSNDGEMGGYSRNGGYSGRRYYSRDNYSSTRGRRRDSMGRYSRDDGMVEELRMLMQDAPDDQTRKEFQKFISKIEQM